MASKYRGEAVVELNGREWTMKVDFRFMQAMDEKLGMGFQDVQEALTRVRVPVLITLIHEAIISGGNSNVPTLDVTGKWCLEDLGLEGIVSVMQKLYPLMAGITGDEEPMEDDGSGNGETPPE